MSGSTDSAEIAKGKAYAQQVHALLGHEAVLDLNFNENAYNTCSDGKDVCDASGHNDNGIIYNDEAGFVLESIDGYALSFDGVNDYVDMGDILTPDKVNNRSYSVWVNPSAQSLETIFSLGNLYYIKRGFSILTILSPTKLRVAYDFDVSPYVATLNCTTDLNRWNYLVFVIDVSNPVTTNVKVYKNGIYIDQTTQNRVVSGPYHTSFVIGAQTTGVDHHKANFFSGLIDDVRIYAVALPSTEIQKHYVQGLEKLLTNQTITKSEYDKRMEEFNQSLVQNRF